MPSVALAIDVQLVPYVSQTMYGKQAVLEALVSHWLMLPPGSSTVADAETVALNLGSQSATSTAVTDAASGTSSLLICCGSLTSTVTAVASQSPPPTDSGWTVTVSCTYTPITPLTPLFSFFGGTGSSTYIIRASNTIKGRNVPAAMPLMPDDDDAQPAMSGRPGRQRRGAGERGQNMVEFALVIPILALVLFGIVEFGNVIRVQVEIDNAVRNGARWQSLNDPAGSLTSGIQTKVQSWAPDLSGLTASVSTTGCPALTAEVTVTSSYSYIPVTPIGGLMHLYGGSFASPLALSSISTMHSGC